MSTFNTRCPHCNSVNRVPQAKLNETAQCGRCQQPLLDGRPVEGTSDNFNALLNSEKTVVVDFWLRGVDHALTSPLYLSKLPTSSHHKLDSLKSTLKPNKHLLLNTAFVVSQRLWCSKMVSE
ncbi:thioredoxin 2 [Vibrio astriarenae]|nr:thioredoxin 2 [Vibrio sp. C7]